MTPFPSTAFPFAHGHVTGRVFIHAVTPVVPAGVPMSNPPELPGREPGNLRISLHITTENLCDCGIEAGSTLYLDPSPVGKWEASRYADHTIGIRMSGSCYIAKVQALDCCTLVSICGEDITVPLTNAIEIVGIVDHQMIEPRIENGNVTFRREGS